MNLLERFDFLKDFSYFQQYFANALVNIVSIFLNIIEKPCYIAEIKKGTVVIQFASVNHREHHIIDV